MYKNNRTRIIISIIFLMCIVLGLVSCHAPIESIEQGVYENFSALYMSDFDKIKNKVVENGNHVYFMSLNPVVVKYRSKHSGERIEISLSDDEEKSVHNIVSHSINQDLRMIYVDENMVFFCYHGGGNITGNGIMYSENIEAVKKNASVDKDYFHLMGFWYAVIV